MSRGFRTNDPYFLQDFSGINEVKNEALVEFRENKDKHIREKIEYLFNTKQHKFIVAIEDIIISVTNTRHRLENSKAEELDDKLKNFTNALNSIRAKVKKCFEMAIINSKKELKGLELLIEESIESNQDIEVSTHTREKTSTSGFLFFKKTTYTTTTTHTANVCEAVRNLSRFATRAKRFVHDEIGHVFNEKKVKDELKRIILTAFDTKSLDFDESEIIDPVELVLSKITIPNIDVDTQPYEKMISSAFSGSCVEGADIGKLVSTQNSTMKKMLGAFRKELEDLATNIERTLMCESGTFVDKIEAKLQSDITRLKNQLAEREKHLADFDAFLKYIGEAKSIIKNLREL